MERENLKFVMVGHVDHGKSTLIGRLLYNTNSLPEGKIEEIKAVCEKLGRPMEFAFVMDHLEEEREQNITIDTAQTFFKTFGRDYVIIDAPGHKEFLKNMITGASQAEAAVLIVDAKEGVREQTRRHAYLLSLLGLTQLIVAVNKMDLVSYSKERFDEIGAEILSFMKSVGIVPAYVIPISARQGDNITTMSEMMGWYSSLTLLDALGKFKTVQSSDEKPLRLPVQDVYNIDGKRILVGRVETGKIKVGQEITFLPQGRKTKVASIEVYLKDLKEAGSGYSIGITLEDLLFIERGAVACDARKPGNAASAFSAKLFWMARKPLHSNQPITLKCATQEVSCVVERISRRIDSSTIEMLGENADRLEETEVGEVVIKTRKPVVLELFRDIPELGRFVLCEGMEVLAGGIVTGIG